MPKSTNSNPNVDSVRYRTIGRPFLVGYNVKMNMASGSRILIDLFVEQVSQTKLFRPDDDTHNSKMRESRVKRNICVPGVVTNWLSMGIFMVTG